LAMEQDQFFGGPFALRILNPHTGLRSYPLNDKKWSESQWVSLGKGYCTGGGDSEARVGQGAARCPPCSQNAHDETVLVRFAQLRATSATPPILGRGSRGRRKERREACRFPVLAQRAVADSPRWTRAHWETARLPLRLQQSERVVEELLGGRMWTWTGPTLKSRISCLHISRRAQ
jgi:hypothetical protein